MDKPANALEVGFADDSEGRVRLSRMQRMPEAQNAGLLIQDLGLIDYQKALALQRGLRDQVLAGAAPETLLLLEHPPVFTLGRGSGPGEFLTPPAQLRARGFAIAEVERGGKTTYHGPGQLVGYPILSLERRGLGVRQYVALLEQCLIDVLAAWGVLADRRAGNPGVWAEDRKIAALGVHVKQGVTMHGFALNIHTDLSHFGHIVPCGIADVEVTSVHAELGSSPSMPEAKGAVAGQLAKLLSGLLPPAPRGVA